MRKEIFIFQLIIIINHVWKRKLAPSNNGKSFIKRKCSFLQIAWLHLHFILIFFRIRNESIFVKNTLNILAKKIIHWPKFEFHCLQKLEKWAIEIWNNHQIAPVSYVLYMHTSYKPLKTVVFKSITYKCLVFYGVFIHFLECC